MGNHIHLLVRMHTGDGLSDDEIRRRFHLYYGPASGREVAAGQIPGLRAKWGNLSEYMREITQSGELKHLAAERSWREIECAMQTGKPSEFVSVLRECEALAALLPEIDCLFGVPQPEKYHPEIDTGVHLQMALDIAAELATLQRLEHRPRTVSPSGPHDFEISFVASHRSSLPLAPRRGNRA